MTLFPETPNHAKLAPSRTEKTKGKALIEKYAAMIQRAAPFEGRANWVLAALACAAIWFGFLIIFFIGYAACCGQPNTVFSEEALDAFFLGSTPLAVQLNLASFAIYIGLLWCVMRWFHGLGLVILLGPLPQAMRNFFRVALYLSPLYLLIIIPALASPQVYRQWDVLEWTLILLPTLPFLFIQIGAEEVIFRGYLQSHLAALSYHPLVWMVIPSILFGLIHYDGSQPAYSAWAYVIWASCLGLVCADLTARSGSLGPALAVHFINNFFAMMVLANDEWLFGASLYVWRTYGQPWEPWIPFEALFLFTVWLSARLAIRR